MRELGIGNAAQIKGGTEAIQSIVRIAETATSLYVNFAPDLATEGINSAAVLGTKEAINRMGEVPGMLSRVYAWFDRKAYQSVWKLPPQKRGELIEAALAKTEFRDWFHVGALEKGKFPLVDFQKGQDFVSLKTVDTRGLGWMDSMQEHMIYSAYCRTTR